MSVRPSIFFDAKNIQNLGETGSPVPVFISMASDQLLSPAERAVTVGCDTATAVCVWVCVCARVHAGACEHVCVRAWVGACVCDVFAIYDNNV